MADTTTRTVTLTAADDARASERSLFLAGLAPDEREFAAACLQFYRRFGSCAADKLLGTLGHISTDSPPHHAQTT